MAEFLKDTQLVSAIEQMIEKADKFIWLISPYIKLHDRIKTLLTQVTKASPAIEVVIVFGKNESDLHKSIGQEDVDFLKTLPVVTIGYEKRLHAKFYASEDFSIITSMNLHQFSANNNIEAGIKMKASKLFNSNDGSTDDEAMNYFNEVIENCTIIFEKVAVYKSVMLGLMEEYTHSEVKKDDTEIFFKQPEYIPKQFYQKTVKPILKTSGESGFCIRTGKSIPFNVRKPMCNEAYQSWGQFKNLDYKEKYCHKTGRPSNGKTSMRNPILH